MKRDETMAMMQTFLIRSGTGKFKKKQKTVMVKTLIQKKANDKTYERIEPDVPGLLSAILFSAIVALTAP